MCLSSVMISATSPVLSSFLTVLGPLVSNDFSDAMPSRCASRLSSCVRLLLLKLIPVSVGNRYMQFWAEWSGVPVTYAVLGNRMEWCPRNLYSNRQYNGVVSP